MKTTFKISILISIILSSNLLAFDPLDQVIIDDMNNFDVHLDENKVDWVDFIPTRDKANVNEQKNIEQDTKFSAIENKNTQQDADIQINTNKSNANEQKDVEQDDRLDAIEAEDYVDTITFDDEVESLYEYVDDEIFGYTNDTQTINEQGETIETSIEVEGTIYETIFGQDKTVFNLDTGEIIEETTLKKGLIERVNELESNPSNVDLTQINNDINTEKQRNDNQDVLISNNTNLSQNNHSRLNQKDIVDSKQNQDIQQNKNDIAELKNERQKLVNFLMKETDKKFAVLGALNHSHQFVNGNNSLSVNTINYNSYQGYGISYAVKKDNFVLSISGASDFKSNKAVKLEGQLSF